jgi:NTE family protein
MVDPSSTTKNGNPPWPTAVVLTGGGARGAYEAGVLQFLHETLMEKGPCECLFDILAGTSAGALNACTLGAMAHDPQAGVKALVSYWRSITMERLLKFGSREVARLPNVIMGRRLGLDSLGYRKRPKQRVGPPHPPVAGLFDTSPLYKDMLKEIPWHLLDENIRKGVIRGIAVCATELCTSKSIVFYQVHEDRMYWPGQDPAKEERLVKMSVQHAMASAAIPFLFPAVQIDSLCYVDGALRQNAPLHPALRMGAEKVLIVGLSREPDLKYRTARMSCQRNPFPGSLFLLGRTVNAVMDGVLDHEIHRVGMFNELILKGQARYGESFLEDLNQVAHAYRNADYRLVDVKIIRPSRNLNEVAIEALKEAPDELGMPGLPGRLVKNVMTSSPFLESELSSYLMFTPTYIRKLIDLGYEDAKQREGELTSFLTVEKPGGGEGVRG